jgi:hypothetical protein
MGYKDVAMGASQRLALDVPTTPAPGPAPAAPSGPGSAAVPAPPRPAADVAAVTLAAPGPSADTPPANDLAGGDVLAMPSDLLARCPVPFSLLWLSPGRDGIRFYTTWWLDTHRALRNARHVVLGASEWDALCIGAQQDRGTDKITQWLSVKVQHPQYEIGTHLTVGDIVYEPTTRTYTVGEVCKAWNLSLIGVDYAQN